MQTQDTLQVSFKETYAYKISPYSSHEMIRNFIRPNSRVLDVGCGRGLLAEKLVNSGNRVSGIDSNPASIVFQGMEDYRQLDLEREYLKINYSEKFDSILLADVVEHVRNPEQLLRHLSKFLSPEGNFVISTGNIAIWYYRLSLLTGRFNYGARGILDETHVRLYTLASFKSLVERAGCQVSKISYTNLPFELAFKRLGQGIIGNSLDKIYRLFVNLWPKMFAYQIVLEAKPLQVT